MKFFNMLILGIDPGSITTGWALIESKGKKLKYIASGVLKFDKKKDFLDRLTQIKKEVEKLAAKVRPDEVAFESLIFVKSPSALIKLAQTRGVLLSAFVEKYEGKVFEYAPNTIKSSTIGHGHADKKSVEKFLEMLIGKQNYATDDESDAVAIAICHHLNRGKKKLAEISQRKKTGGLQAALVHKIG